MVLLVSERSRNWVEINAIHFFMKEEDAGSNMNARERDGRQADYESTGFAKILL